MSGKFSEDALVEQPALSLLAELGWESVSAFEESFEFGPSARGMSFAQLFEGGGREAFLQAVAASPIGYVRGALEPHVGSFRVVTGSGG